MRVVLLGAAIHADSPGDSDSIYLLSPVLGAEFDLFSKDV